ncbi:MAG TPA: AMP-dependent synthetase/ligase [Pseudonocardia sp.]|nr:AMP-dependent synthetase/ligase [Pseudonocardia sp.]
MQLGSAGDPVSGSVRPKNLAAAFLARATSHPERLILSEYGSPTALSLGEWATRSRAIAGGLSRLGVTRGERIGLLLRNRIEFHLVDMGALLIGAVPFSLYLTAPVNQLSEIVANAGPTVLIVEAASLPLARAVRAQHPGITHVVVIDPGEVVDGELADGELADGELGLAELEAGCPDDFDAVASADEAASTDICTLVYTSGTTGPPKGVPFQHGAMLDCLDSIRQRFASDEADRAISYLPMAHIAERIFGHYAAFVYGYEVTSLPDMSQLNAALRDVRPTRFFGVPRIYEKVLGGLHTAIAAAPEREHLRAELRTRVARVREGHPAKATGDHTGDHTDDHIDDSAASTGHDPLRPFVEATGLDQAHFLAVAGAPSTLEVLEELTAFGLPINEFYGSSEMIVVTASPPERIKLGTVGTAFPGMELRLGDDGEVLVSGPQVMPGYFHDPERTAEVLDAEGWFHTGDIGSLDEDGYLRIVDRKKALIINSAGKNMSPATIEQAIKGGQPLLAQVFAVGDRQPYNVALIVLDREGLASFAAEHGLGQSPFAELSHHPRVLDTIAAVVATGNQRLSRVEQIKRFRVLDHDWSIGSSFLTPTAKLKRAEIQAHYRELIEELYA